MSSILHIAGYARQLGALSARTLPTAIALICATHLAGPLSGQSFSACGSNICASTGASVGIGTTAPIARLDVPGSFHTGSNTSNWFPWIDGGDYLQLIAGASFQVQLQAQPNFIVLFTVRSTDGNVGIGTSNPQSKLAVNGTITTREVVVTNTGWSDYVFRPDYRLRPLNEVAAYVKEHHHLPEIPSEAEVKEKGVGVGEMQSKLLAKIEELTLHMIHADERNNLLEQQNRELQERIARLENSAVTGAVK